MKIRILFLILFVLITFNANAEIFLDERYRGWFWFEKKNEENSKEKLNITAKYSQEIIEQFRSYMDMKRNIMLVNPNAETVREYMAFEDLMWQKALALDAAYREAKFKYPEYFDLSKEPQNIYAVKFKRRLEQEYKEEKIKKFAKKFDLVFFSKESCKYCKEFAPVLKNFVTQYGFKIEEVSSEGKNTGFFSWKYLPYLAAKLGITITPTVVAISKDEKNAFELVRGYVSLSELEEYVILAADYMGKQK